MTLSFRSTPARIATLLALCAGAAHAAGDTEFLKMVSPFESIIGESTAAGHQGWTDVAGISWKVEAATSFVRGSGVAVGKAVPSAIGWNQDIDSTVPFMYRQITSGRSLRSATFDHVRAGNATGSPYLSLGLKNGFFTDLSISTAGISPKVVAKEFALTYDLAKAGQAPQLVTTSWDAGANTVSSAPTLAPNIAVGQGVAPAAAPGGATQAYLRLGQNIAGSSVAKGYENWIPVSTAGWDVFAPTSFTQGTGASVGKATPGPLTWTQGLDATLLVSLAKIASGTSLPQVTLEFVKDAGAGPVTFMQMAMNDVYFTSLGVDGHMATESVVFKSVSQTVWKINSDGTRAGLGVTFEYDFPSEGFAASRRVAAVAGFGLGNLSPTLAAAAPQPFVVDLPGAVGPVPEPQSWALMLGGGALLLGAVRRRRDA